MSIISFSGDVGQCGDPTPQVQGARADHRAAEGRGPPGGHRGQDDVPSGECRAVIEEGMCPRLYCALQQLLL